MFKIKNKISKSYIIQLYNRFIELLAPPVISSILRALWSERPTNPLQPASDRHALLSTVYSVVHIWSSSFPFSHGAVGSIIMMLLVLPEAWRISALRVVLTMCCGLARAASPGPLPGSLLPPSCVLPLTASLLWHKQLHWWCCAHGCTCWFPCW